MYEMTTILDILGGTDNGDYDDYIRDHPSLINSMFFTTLFAAPADAATDPPATTAPPDPIHVYAANMLYAAMMIKKGHASSNYYNLRQVIKNGHPNHRFYQLEMYVDLLVECHTVPPNEDAYRVMRERFSEIINKISNRLYTDPLLRRICRKFGWDLAQKISEVKICNMFYIAIDMGVNGHRAPQAIVESLLVEEILVSDNLIEKDVILEMKNYILKRVDINNDDDTRAMSVMREILDHVRPPSAQ